MEITKEEYERAKKALSEAYMYGEPSGYGATCYDNELAYAREIVGKYEDESEGCSFMQAVKWMKEGNKVRRKSSPNIIIYSNPQCNSLYYHNHPQNSFGYSGCIIDFEATDWEIYKVKSEFAGMTMEELIYQAHMMGQVDFGCTNAGYSNARADCSEIIKELKSRAGT